MSETYLGTLLSDIGLSVAEAAARAGVHRTTLSQAVHGHRALSTRSLYRIAKALQLSPEEVFAILSDSVQDEP